MVIGCLLVAIRLWVDDWYLPPLGIFLGSWFWIPPSMAARDKSRTRARLACGLIVAAVLVAGLMGAGHVSTLIAERYPPSGVLPEGEARWAAQPSSRICHAERQ